MRSFPRFAVLTSLLGLQISVTHAAVTQPNGMVVPTDSNNGEIQLFTFFAQRGEPIDWKADAHAAPTSFVPRCDFSASLVLKQAATSQALAWYNIVADAAVAPSTDELHVVVPEDSSVGMVVSAAAIREHADYAGGAVGFALLTSPAQFSDLRWNPMCSGCALPGPWVMGLTYASKLEPNAHYLAFEDRVPGPGAHGFNNDGDYNDKVFLVRGARCAQQGLACDTALPGACAAGTTRCTGDAVVCEAIATATAERCDGIDNDCNGQIDEGASCDAGEVCSKGACVPSCADGGPACAPGSVCNARGVCVQPSCAQVSCSEPGEVCVEGSCQQPCAGVACPGETVCRQGACVDACAGVVCGQDEVCTAGVCRAACDSCDAACASGEACDLPSGRCVLAACAGVTCEAGSRCVEGSCVDSCVGAVCPSGQRCELGSCVDIPYEPDAGAPDAGDTDAGEVDAGAQDAGAPDAAANDAGSDDAGGSPSSDAGSAPDDALAPIAGGGCDCHTAPSSSGALWGALGLLGLLRRRRVARRARAAQRPMNSRFSRR